MTLQACDRIGRPLEGAPVITAHATVHDDEASRAALDTALSEKYGVQYAAIRAMGRLRVRRTPGSVVVRLDALETRDLTAPDGKANVGD